MDPYIGCAHYCYYCNVLREAETDWRREVRIHHDIEGQLALELLEDLSECAATMWIYGLSAKSDDEPDTGWKNTRHTLDNHFPGITDQVQAAVQSKNHSYWIQLKEEIKMFNRYRNLDLRIHV
ncbi:MAG: hypothetical protein KJO28_13345 [Desulfofustis sp.]|nr:hypothetical protein [Desulfofustis sp.]